ncbi:hypothetical protein FSP39_001430 [Pinctada imbricata]|uniref:Biogenesis of lysosome-related organelles complex 1 subunit 3 n=1 Tax=Pinctada imbricata TaxID=66713 RepID=A0AA88Y2H1_PINIB|nr:hypothetical protein FSP39_001430 [Pinctada imbricata]
MEPATVIPGEASESDDDEITQINTKQIKEQTQIKSSQATVVSGEASESDEDEETDKDGITPLKVDTGKKGDRDDITSGEIPLTPTSPGTRYTLDIPIYDSLLHRKLRERNGIMRRHIIDTVQQVYNSASKDLHNTTLQLHKSQSSVMDASHHLKLLTNDLFYLEDKMDIVSNCPILPDIHFPSKQTTT